MSLQSFPIIAIKSGLKKDVKPAFLPQDAWSFLENAYCYRERVLKREGLKLMGRLQRILSSQSLGTTPAVVTSITFNNIFTTLNSFAPPNSPITNQPNAQISPGTLVITIGAPDNATFTDLGNGTFSVTGNGKAAGSYINYSTGKVVLQFNVATTGGATITANISYFPSLPVMGIVTIQIANVDEQTTIWFDEIYAYIWSGTQFSEFLPAAGVTWLSSDHDFFWGFNYRGSGDQIPLLFVTNFVSSTANPMRYTDGSTWTTFAPLVTATQTLFSARIIVAYYGRLLALNTWEGLTAMGAGSATNFFNRCRFSQLGDATDQTFGWRSDLFGRGGFLDAPTTESITSVTFIRNTLVVTFEQSTWQLRYVGEYGLPFVWERISSDFGSGSTFSSVLFDNYMLYIGDKAVLAANANSVERIDLDIPDEVFNIFNINNGPSRIYGIRNYQKELIFWNFLDPNAYSTQTPYMNFKFPNKVFVYNYRNKTWAKFRDNVTAFGNFQISNSDAVTWDSLVVTWDDENVTWDDPQNQAFFPSITCGNQEGFVSLYQTDVSISTFSPIQEQPSLSISGVNLGTTPIQLTVTNHNLGDSEIIYITGLMFLDGTLFTPITTNLNGNFYEIQTIDANTISILKWNFTNQKYEDNFSFTPSPANYLYIGGGQITLIPRLNATTKDINVYQLQSLQTKLSRLDFLMEPSTASSTAINLIVNSQPTPTTTDPDNLSNPVWPGVMSTVLAPQFFTEDCDYAWFRYYATLAAQYFKINLTFDDNMMNTESTHYDPWTLYAINAWCRPGGKNVF